MLMDLVVEARRQGVLIYVDAGSLKAKAIGDALTGELREKIRAHKSELIELLAGAQPRALDDACLQAQEAFWIEALRAAPHVHELPLDRSRDGAARMDTLAVDSLIGADLCARLDTLASHLGNDRFHVLHAAFATLISRWSGQATVVVGSRLPQRLHPDGLGRDLPCHEVLPISVEISADATLAGVLERTSVAFADAHEHGDLPLLLIADLLKLERDTQHPPVLQLLFLEQPLQLAGDVNTDLPARFDLAASARALPHGGLALDWTYDQSLFEPETIQALTRSFAKLIDSLVQHPDDALHALDLVADDDWSRIVQWNSTGRDFDHAARLHDLFAAHVAATPDAIALVCADQRISYAALDEQARRLAAHLRSLGVGPDSVVAVCVPRTSELIVGILGVLMAGGAYLPIDPAYPQERIAYILQDSAACVLLTHSLHLPQLPDAGIAAVCLDRPDAFAVSALGAAVGRDTTADDLAYLIYTSGSTGKPKGVALAHRGAINLHANQVRHFGLSPASRVLQFASIGFDAATWEWIMALLSGGTLFLCPDERRTSATALADFLVEQRITHATLPPALLSHMDPHRDYALQALIVAGEACPESLREIWAGRVPMFNGYGPSETTVCASVERLQAEGRVSIGRPLDNVQTYVVDDRLRLSPIGAVGELMIGGVALARGYVGNPQLTAERFIECSLRPGHRQRLYCSGDLVRYLPDGRLDFVGRKDDQIKLRGFRIEPREIEAILGAHALVGHATVVLRQTDRASSLAAYVVPATAMDVTARRALGDELLQHLAGQVPDYMVPATLTVVEAFPLTANGKIDKHALLALDAAGAGDDMVEARTEVERALERMWCELLKLERVGVHENFFAIGGDSILSIQAVARANQAGIPVTIRQLFEFTTIAGIAANLAESGPALEPVGDASGEMSLMPMQARFLSEQTDAPHHFNQSILLDVPADMDEARLLAIAAALVARHDALRLAFPVGDDGHRHAIHQDLASYPIGETVRVETMDDSHASFAAFVRERSDAQQRGFCLDHAPLFRLVLLRGQGQSRLLLVAHHLIVDGVSWRILLQDLELAYAQLTSQQDIALSAKPASYQQWATALSEYADEAKLREELPYWLEQAEAAPLAIAPDHADAERPRQSSTRYASIELSEDQTRQLLRQCNEPYRTNINELLLASLYLGLQAFGDSGRLQVAVEGHGRETLFDRLDSSQTVGWFTSVFPLNFRIESREIGAAIRCIKEQYRRIPRGGVGYGVLRYMARDQALVHDSRQGPQILFNYLGQFDSALGEQGTFRFADEDTGASGDGAHRRDYPLGINGLVSGGKLRFTVDYSDEEFRPETIERLAESFREGLSAVIEHCLHAQSAFTPSDFPLARISSTEMDGLQQRYDIARLYPATAMQHGLLFHTLVDAQAYTSQIALSFDGQLQPTLMRQAWEAVAHRHDVLRTAIVGSDEQPHQLVARRIELPWNEIDLRHLPAQAQEDEFVRQRLAQRHQGFDLETPPLMRLSLFRLDDARYRLLWSHHHMLLDGWSLPMVYRDVMEHYEALLAHRQPDVEGFRPYEDYVAWLQDRDMAAARDYWRGYLREVESPTPLSIDKLPAEAVRQHRFIELTLSIEATTQLQELARRSHTTLYTVLQYAWGWLLHKYSGESTVVFGAILSGRPAELVDVERMVGLFINTLPVKVVVDMTQRIEEALGELHRAFQQSAEFGYLPLADIRRQTSLPAGAALFDSLLVLENYPLDEAIGAEPRASLALSGVDAFDETDYKLTLNASLSDRLSIRCSYHTDTFGDRVIERLLGHLESILTQLPTHELPAGIALLTPQERQALEHWRTAEPSEGQRCIHRRFEQRAQSTPDAVALVCEDETLSYAELNTQANRLAHALRGKGVQAETLVGLCVERGVQMMVGILGILKAGGAYVPFDPATPRARLAYMLEDSAIGIVVSEAAALEVLPDTITELVLLDDPSLARHSSDDLAITAVDAGPESAAYVIYTSGSTGKPKGVLVEHRHVDRLFTVTDRHFGFTDRDVWTLFHSYAFDFSVWEMWGALFYGGKLVIVPKLVARSPELFYELVAQSGVTVLNQTPAAFEQFARVDEQANTPLSLRYVIFGGAALDYYTLQPWMERHPALPRMINMYGITETTVHVTFREVTRDDVAHGRGSMIGWPLADLTAVVLDAQGRPLPIGVAGELYVGGAGVSRGYLDRPELTAERFIANPDVAGAVLYRTGDLVRRHESGELEYLGRIDNQVKIRGFRIELGEIESELNRVDLVRESLVLAQGEAADKRLIAYVVANDTAKAGADARECSDRIRAALSQVLPDYMVPAVIMVIAAFPLNINGKVDRAALPPPDAGVSAGGWTEPRNETQRHMAAIWQDVLGLARVGIDDNFFAVGGDSIRAIPLISRFKQAGFAVSIKDLFEAPTIALLSTRAEGACQEMTAVDLAPFALVDPQALEALGYRLDNNRADERSLHDAYPMTALQQGMVFHNLLSADRTAYHDVMSFHVRTPWDASRFEQALQLLVDRHEMLRTAFHLDGEIPLQLVLARHLPELEVIDQRHLDIAAQENTIAEAVKAERSSEFDYARPPWRVVIHLRSEGEFQYTLSFHHAILDGWSVANFNTQLFNAYLRESQAAAIVPQHLPFRHYVQMELEASHDPSVRTAWREKLEGVELPWWAGKPKRQTLNGIQRLQPSISQGLVDLAQRMGVQERSVLLTAHVVLMALLDGRTDVVTSVVSNGRPEREGADLTLGLFLNSLPFRVQVQDETWAQLVRRVDREVAAYYAVRHLPLSEIQAECGLDFSASLFNYINFHVYQSLDEQLDVLGAQGAEEKNYAISLSFSKAIGTQGPQFDVSIDVDSSLFPEPFFRRIEGYLRSIAATMAADGDAQVSLDGLLGADERDTQLHAWNDNSTRYHDAAVHRGFEAQVEKTPDAVAVTYRGVHIDYAELNRRANQVAHALIAHGATTGQRVGLCLENSIEMLVGTLAILKTGAAYVPLDPAHPRDRIRQVIDDSGMQVLLTQRHLKASLDDADTVTLALDESDWYEGLPHGNPEANADASTLAPAYVVYTSGSTGRPKGVVVGHRALAIYLSHALATYHAPHLGGSLVATSFAFDLTKPALFLPLLSGGRVELLDAADPLGDLTRRVVDIASGDRLIRATPMHVQAMLDLLPPQATSEARHAFVIGGEAFSPALATSLQARFPRSVIHNHYGPSEAVVGCAMYDVTANIDELGDTLPIGRGMANTALYVLNERLQPSPIGVPGILHVAGDGLADGYLGQPELTRAAFLDNPFATGSLARMYRTGDRVRYGEDGNLLFLGRADDQVKLRGFRIELGEIDALVRQLPFVKEAVVVAKGTGSDKALVAYVVAHPEAEVEEIGDAVKTALRGRLPEYMVPAAVVCLPALPLSGNGKIDRRRLPDPDWSAGKSFVAPEGEFEIRLARIWADILGAEAVGATDNFFDLGGHSLKATRLVSAISREFAITLPLVQVFQTPFLRAMAKQIEQQCVIDAGRAALDSMPHMTEMEW